MCNQQHHRPSLNSYSTCISATPHRWVYQKSRTEMTIESNPISTIPPSFTRIGYVVNRSTPTVALDAGLPVSRSNRMRCNGHSMTTSSMSSTRSRPPSSKSAPMWVHTGCVAKSRSPTLNTAMSVSLTLTGMPHGAPDLCGDEGCR